ncbi:MAG: hypothetical protein FJZ90_10315 [Chloroflexi bacterium]|nr:hypothetical protein [Chloroflexota bacterium]
MAIDVHFDERDWERIERDYAAWWAHELDRPLVQIMGKEYDPTISYPEILKFQSNYPLDMPAEGLIDALTLELEATRYYGDAFPRWGVNFGPGIVAGFLGARVHSVEETVWFEPPRQVPARDVRLAYQPDNVWWLRVKELTQAAVERWGDRVQVSHTDLGGNLDIVASFRTTEGLLFDLYDAPEEVERLVNEITALWMRYYEELERIIRPPCRGYTPWAPIWSKERCYMLQCDFSYMISPEMFARFVMPDLIACCDYLEHGFYHWDGPGQIPHLDLLLSIPRLRGIQWVPGEGNPPPHEWPALLKRIIEGGKLCQLFVSAEGALSIVRNLGGKGFMLTIQDEMSADKARAFLKRIAQEDASRRR